MAAVNPTPTAIAAATAALLEINEVAERALVASQMGTGEDGPAVESEGDGIDQLEEDDEAVESEESSEGSSEESDSEESEGDMEMSAA